MRRLAQKTNRKLTDLAGSKVRMNSLELSDPTEVPLPPNRKTGVVTPLSHCAFCGVADYIAATFRKMAYRHPKTGIGGGLSQKSLPLKPIAP